MTHNMLLTGASGYLGGTLLARLVSAKLYGFDHVYALVRKPSQAEEVQKFGARSLTFDAYDEASVRAALVENQITIVFYMIDCIQFKSQEYFIKALAAVKNQVKRDVHFIYTSGAKLFEAPAGAPTNSPLLDTNPELYNIQKAQRGLHDGFNQAVGASSKVVELSEQLGVRSYNSAPCIVYGKGEEFGNKITIQTVAIIRAAKASGRVYKLEDVPGRWPVCHLRDNTSLYIQILKAILSDNPLSHGKNGDFLASSGSIKWNSLYVVMAVALKKRGVIQDDKVALADDLALEKMAVGLR